MKLNHILLVSQNVEKEQALFDWTLALAQQQQATITVLCVLPEISPGLVGWLKNHMPSDVMVQQTQVELAARHAWGLKANQVGVNLTTHIEFGKPFYKAIQMILKAGIDFVVKQTDEPESSLSRYVFGSQDLHLLRKCPCPVLLHKQQAELPFKRIMASVDVDIEAENLTPNRLNQTILDCALMMAQDNQAELTVAHAWQAEAENLVRYWNSDLAEADVLRFSEEVQRQHAVAVEYEIQTLREMKPDVKVILPKGRAAQAIPHVAETNTIDLLVMGTLGRSGLSGLVIGNTAETILEQIQCSVLAVKPEGFVSPITL